MYSVENIDTHKVGKEEIVIVKGVLMLIQRQPEDDTSFAEHPNFYDIKPIVISLTEKINDGDYHIKKGGTYIDNSDIEWCHKKKYYKVLALPEHFSIEQLKDIVNGELKNGDAVMIECDHEMMAPDCEAYQCNHPLDPVEYTCDNKKCTSECVKLKWVAYVKLNSFNSIKLYKVEEELDAKQVIMRFAARCNDGKGVSYEEAIKILEDFEKKINEK